MGNNCVTRRQYALLIFFIPFVYKFAMLPSLLFKTAGRDMWVTIACMLALEFLQLALIVKIDSMGGVEELRRRYGIVGYCAIAVPVILLTVSKSMVYLAEIANYTSSYLFYNVTNWNLTVILVVVIAFVALKGAKGIGRLAEITVWLLPVIVFVGVVFGKIKIEPSYVLPILAEGFAPVAVGFDKFMFWAFDFAPMLFITIRKEKTGGKSGEGKRRNGASIFAAAFSAFVIITMLFVFYIMNYGGGGYLVNNAFASLGTFNVVNTEIGSIDGPTIVIWLSTAVFSMAVKAFACGSAVSGFGVKYPVAVVAATVVVLVSALTIFVNVERAVVFAKSFARYIIVGLDIAVVFVAFIMLAIKPKIQNETPKSTEIEKNCGETARVGAVEVGGE